MKNFLLNAILFVLFVAVMSFQLLPKVLHENFRRVVVRSS